MTSHRRPRTARAARAAWIAAGFSLAVASSAAVAGCGAGTPAPAAAPAHPPHHHHRFDDAASWSKVFDDPARDAWQRPAHVVHLMEIAPAMTVADIGAGTGYFEPYLSRAVGADGHVLAVDLEPDMVRWLDGRAKREGLANVRVSLATPTDPRLPEAGVDRVLVVDTWHHIEDRAAYARTLARALTPSGAVYVVDFTKESPHGPPPRARLAPADVIRDFTEAGLRAEVVPSELPHQFVVRARR